MRTGSSTSGVEIRTTLSRLARTPADGALELLKWLALATMVVDHVGRLVYGVPQTHWAGQVGRISFPLFALVLGTRLALRAGRYGSVRGATAWRLLLWGLASTPFYFVATGLWWPPAIFFTFALGAAVCWLRDVRWKARWKILAHAAIAVLSFGCAYLAPGVYLVPAICAFYRKPGRRPLSAIVLCAVGLVLVNLSLATLVAFALWPLAHLRLPRVPTHGAFFYVFYPAHLALLAAWIHWR